MNKKGIIISLNVLWFLFFGLINSVIYASFGISLCLTIIGIPFGIQYLKSIPLIAFPVGKRVITHFAKTPSTCVLNIIWLIFGGLISYIITIIFVMLLYLSIIGIPFASQLKKINHFFLAPFGVEIVKFGELSTDLNTETEENLNLILDRFAFYSVKYPDKVMQFIIENKEKFLSSYENSQLDKNLIEEYIYAKELPINDIDMNLVIETIKIAPKVSQIRQQCSYEKCLKVSIGVMVAFIITLIIAIMFIGSVGSVVLFLLAIFLLGVLLKNIKLMQKAKKNVKKVLEIFRLDIISEFLKKNFGNNFLAERKNGFYRIKYFLSENAYLIRSKGTAYSTLTLLISIILMKETASPMLFQNIKERKICDPSESIKLLYSIIKTYSCYYVCVDHKMFKTIIWGENIFYTIFENESLIVENVEK